MGWGGLILLAHQTTEWAILWTHRLFGWMLLLTYLLLWGWAIGISRKPRRTLLGGFTCTITILMILICVELPALLGIVHWDLVFQKLTGKDQKYTWAYWHDRELGFRRRPNDHWTEWPTSDIERQWNMPPSLQQPLEFTYDRWGYRNPDEYEEADVALIGDSFVEGWYVSDEQTVAHRLSTRLDRPVVNLGVAGYGPMQELLVLQRDGLRVHPKVVIWFFFEGNDLYDDYKFEPISLAESPTKDEEDPSHQGLAFDQGIKARLFTFALLDRLRRWSTLMIPSHSPYFGHLMKPGQEETVVYFANYAAFPWTDWEANGWEKVKGTLAKVAELSNARDVRILFVFVPIKFRVYKPFVTLDRNSPCQAWEVWPIDKLFAEFCRSADVPCLDLTPVFQQSIQEGDMPYAATDSHWNAEGHNLVAKKLAEELPMRGWILPSPAQSNQAGKESFQ